jgi:aminoglycoside N3'-acetyltransferase
MKATSNHELRDHLQRAGVEQGVNLTIHSNLSAFGLLEGGVSRLYETLREMVGPHGTIAVPAYRIGTPSDEIFDPEKSPSFQVGAFSEYVRKLEGTRRTANPIHSHALQGPLADLACRVELPASFGQTSDFEFFVTNRFKVLFLGCDFENAGTLVFHAQACAGNIPYRSWQTAKRKVMLRSQVDGGERVVELAFPYYARINGAPKETRRGLERELRAGGLIREAKLPYGASLAFEYAPVHAELLKIFARNPLACVSESETQA